MAGFDNKMYRGNQALLHEGLDQILITYKCVSRPSNITFRSAVEGDEKACGVETENINYSSELLWRRL